MNTKLIKAIAIKTLEAGIIVIGASLSKLIAAIAQLSLGLLIGCFDTVCVAGMRSP